MFLQRGIAYQVRISFAIFNDLLLSICIYFAVLVLFFPVFHRKRKKENDPLFDAICELTSSMHVSQ